MSYINRPYIETISDRQEFAGALLKCINNCVYFTENLLDITDIHEYNKPFLNCKERFIVFRSGRQVGKTRNAAIKAIHFGFFAPLLAHNIGEGVANVIIASISKDQATLIFNKIVNFVRRSNLIKIRRETKSELTIDWFDGSGKTNFIVRPVGDTGESLRGFTTHMAIIDEAGYIPEVVYDAFLPSAATTRARILLTSTPRGKSGAFFNACEKSFAIYRHGVREELHEKDGKYKWIQFHVTTYDNPDAASDPEILELISGSTEASRQQELMGEFLDGGNSLIPYNQLQFALITQEYIKEFDYFDLGVDTSGKGKDETVLTTLGVKNGYVYPLHIYTETTTSQPKLARKISEMHSINKYRKIFIDGTGIGDALIDNCKEIDPTLPIRKIDFTKSKTDLYKNIARLFETKKINLTHIESRYTDKLTEQLQYLYWDYGKYKDQQPKVRTEHADDYSDSFALACFGQRGYRAVVELEYQ